MNEPLGIKRGKYGVIRVFGQLLSGLAGKVHGLCSSYRLTRHRTPLSLEKNMRMLSTSLLDAPSIHVNERTVTREEERICSAIRDETSALNRNNLTRTAAYWHLFKAFPELQWSFLAHMVSRNGGWSMTDLKGEWLPYLLEGRHVSAIFEMLEACNSLIFGDAYPQLRLYAEGRRIGRDLSCLLPQFGVSSFMAPFWSRFWMDRNPVPLSEALIVNEQHFIQLRVVEDAYYRRNVLETLSFQSQPLMQLNQIVFPLWQDERIRGKLPMRLAGRVLEKFEDLRERIEFGKCLYGILFGYPDVLKATTAFASRIPHSGSRADYWPHRFSTRGTQKTGGMSEYSDGTAGNAKLTMWLSPNLSDVWSDREIRPAAEGDWFTSQGVWSYIKPIKLPHVVDITHEHLFGQNKLQAAVLLERSFMNGASSRRTGRG
ncbi:DUF2515 family protein [Cohnella luojiensis]|uniref:DUF2515 domain-containing protein n=1 Tax=Cohnella luojiensis TaxID=652876 RepID=A0A4Y8LTE3_9BACL|nr:DUF2515 family protein [Cohnella luojiensis]TFE24256.1 DUF2515 domain-containing protein [Cohnella luojiensis]